MPTDLSSIDLVAVASSFAEAVRRTSRIVWFRPPWRPSETKPSLAVYPGSQSWYDYGTGNGGDALAFVAVLDGLDLKQRKGMQAAMQRLGLADMEPGEAERAAAERALAAKRRETVDSGRELLEGSRAAEWAAAHYGITLETMRRFELGLGTADAAKRWRQPIEGWLQIPYLDRGRVSTIVWRYPGEVDPKDPKMRALAGEFGHRGLFGAMLAAEIDDPLVLVEGEGDAMAAQEEGLAAVAIGTSSPRAELAVELAALRRPVVLMLDADEPGELASRKWLRLLSRYHVEVSECRAIPAGSDPADAHRERPGSLRAYAALATPLHQALASSIPMELAGRADLLAEELEEVAPCIAAQPQIVRDAFEEALIARFPKLRKASVADTIKRATRRKSDRPSVALRGDLHTRTQTVLELLRGSDWCYTRDGRLAMVRSDKRGRPAIEELALARLRAEIMARHAFTVSVRRKSGFVDEDIEACPDRVLENAIATVSKWRPLDLVASGPVYGPDWRLVASGYSERARVLVLGSPVTAPTRPPTAEELDFAVALWDDALEGFKLDKPSRAAALALALTPIIRPALGDANVPLFLLSAPQEGSGKTLLAQLCALASTGVDPLPFGEPDDPSGWQKRLTAVLLGARQLVLLDNLNASIDSGSLAMALTSSEYEDRLFGSNTRTICIANRTTFVATANNPTQSAEIARRMVLCRIIPGVADPSERDPCSFRWQLPRDAHERRHELTQALVVMIEHWIANERPRGQLRMGSFQDWADAVDGILRLAGVEELGGNKAELAATAEGRQELESFVAGALAPYAGQILSATKLCELAQESGALADMRGSGNDLSQAMRLGRGLRKHVDRVIAGHRLASVATRSGTGYRIERIERIGE